MIVANEFASDLALGAISLTRLLSLIVTPLRSSASPLSLTGLGQPWQNASAAFTSRMARSTRRKFGKSGPMARRPIREGTDQLHGGTSSTITKVIDPHAGVDSRRSASSNASSIFSQVDRISQRLTRRELLPRGEIRVPSWRDDERVERDRRISRNRMGRAAVDGQNFIRPPGHADAAEKSCSGH
jgi:hypothetical protein